MAITLSEAIEEYGVALDMSELSAMTVKAKKYHLRSFHKWAQENDMPTSLNEYKSKHLRLFFLARKEQGVGKGTLEQSWFHLNVFFKWTIKEYKKIKKNPMDNVQRVRYDLPVLEFPEMEVIDRMIEAIPGYADIDIRDTALLELYKSTGARASELLSIELSDIDQENQIVHIRFGKGGNIRRVPYTKSAALAIEHYLKVRECHKLRESPRVFLGRSRPLEYAGLYLVFQRRSYAAIQKRINPHDVRRAFVHLAKQNNVSEETMMELLGWTSRLMLTHYAKAKRAPRAEQEYREKLM